MAERKAFLLRLPPRLHQALKAWAEDEMRFRRRRGRGPYVVAGKTGGVAPTVATKVLTGQ